MIAFYLRLSSADGDLGDDGKDESNSIENQRSILYDYLKLKEDISGDIEEYIDDGYSGTNFDRPAFRKMIEDMKDGRVDVLLTKDLSRLGRNYIEVGDYMEQTFPLLGVRYIAVNSNYDSNNYIGSTLGIEMSMMNLVNTVYSRDLSHKVKSAFETKWKSGRSTSRRPTFGYQLDPRDPAKWIIEPEAATIVRQIFDLALGGTGTKAIAEKLNDDNTITLGSYREKHGYMKNNRRIASGEEDLWDYVMVWKILKTYEYTGALVHGKSMRLSVGSSHTRKVPESERIIYEGHHKAIVTHEEFEQAGAVINRCKKTGKKNTDETALAGIVYCGNCGLKLMHALRKDSYYICSHKSRAGSHSGCCEAKYYDSSLELAVRTTLRQQILLLRDLTDDLKLSCNYCQDPSAQIQKIDSDIRRLKAEKTRLYEAYADGQMDKKRYLKKKDAVRDRLDELAGRKVSILEAAANSLEVIDGADHYLQLAEELRADADLTRTVTDAFIEKVTIYDENHMEVKFKFEDLIEKLMTETGREEIA